MPAIDPFDHTTFDHTAAADDAFDITPDDDNELPYIVRRIGAATSGTVRVQTKGLRKPDGSNDGGTVCNLYVNAGGASPVVNIRKVFATGTSATGIVGII